MLSGEAANRIKGTAAHPLWGMGGCFGVGIAFLIGECYHKKQNDQIWMGGGFGMAKILLADDEVNLRTAIREFAEFQG